MVVYYLSRINLEKTYNLEKSIWTEADFDLMSWHDNSIYALSFQDDYKLVLDIDYIFKWIKKPKAKYYSFWISPCTIVFENVYDLVFDLEISVPSNLIIDRIGMANPQKPKNADYINKQIEYDWVIETISGDISFKSIGFNQYVRKAPILIRQQKFDFNTRGNTSFNTTFES